VLSAGLKAKVGAALLSATLVGGALGAAGHAYVAKSAPPARPPAVPALPRTSATPPSAPELAPGPALPAAPSASAAPEASAPRQDRPRSGGSLRAERLLLETASAALMRGDPRAAIVALRQHARQFPAGDLAEEREVLLVKALAAAGDHSAAEQRAKDFKKRFPDSMQEPSVNDTDRSR